jgi:hypothetical protein
MRRDATGVAQMFLAVGEHGALTTSPFGVDSLTRSDPDFERLQDAFRLLGAAHCALGESATTRSRGFVLDREHPSARLRLGDIDIAVDARDPFHRERAALPAYGIVINSDDVLVIGRGFSVSSPSADDQHVGILAADEFAADGAIRKRLGGDETGSGHAVRLPPSEWPRRRPSRSRSPSTRRASSGFSSTATDRAGADRYVTGRRELEWSVLKQLMRASQDGACASQDCPIRSPGGMSP